MTPELLSTIITALLGGGLTVGIANAVRARNSLRSGARASTRAIIRDMADDRKEAEDRAEHNARVAEYWRAVAGNYSFQLRSNGLTPDPANPVPPEQSVRADAKARRSARQIEDTLTDLDLDDDESR